MDVAGETAVRAVAISGAEHRSTETSSVVAYSYSNSRLLLGGFLIPPALPVVDHLNRIALNFSVCAVSAVSTGKRSIDEAP